MAKKMFLIFNHQLTDKQIKDAKNSLKVEEFIYLSDDLQKLWSQIPATFSKDEVAKFLTPIKDWLEKNNEEEDNVALIQGDFGATCEMVAFCKKIDITPLHSTNKRVVKEVRDGDKVHISHTFEHIIFREY